MTDTNNQVVERSGYVSLNHPLGIFLDAEKYAPIANLPDEASALLKLGLIIENFLSVFILNIRDEGTEDYVKDVRYFMPKLETSVALGLPVKIADAFKLLNKVRNSFAHNLDYQMTQEDHLQLERKISEIQIQEVNPYEYFNSESISPIFTLGVDSLMFVRNAPYAMSDKQRRIMRMVGLVYILSNKCAFFTINKLAHEGRLSIGN